MMQFHMMTLLDVLGKIAWVRQDFLSRVKSQIVLSFFSQISFFFGMLD